MNRAAGDTARGNDLAARGQSGPTSQLDSSAATSLRDLKRQRVQAALPSFDESQAFHLMDDRRLAGVLLERARYSKDERRRAREAAAKLVGDARVHQAKYAGITALLQEYNLSNDEGVLLMCIAESLLRIPDKATADKLINEKLAEGTWSDHLGQSDSFFVNASTWGFVISGNLARANDGVRFSDDPLASFKRLVAKSGESVVRKAVRQAVRLLGRQYISGHTIHDALANTTAERRRGVRYAFDMLGEAAMTAEDAERYYQRYLAAIEAIGRDAGPELSQHRDTLMRRSSLSIKLSALHPRFEVSKIRTLHAELVPRLVALAQAGRENGVAITFDAEEQAALVPLLECFGAVFLDDSTENWPGLGIAVQAYSKRAIPTLRWLRQLSTRAGKRIAVRLVKGAYWDSEIKWAQEQGLKDYPVYTNKAQTDLSYLAAAQLIISEPEAFYPQFATHNAHTLASVVFAAGNATHECQRLYGMGEALFEAAETQGVVDKNVCVYAPVGGYQDLLGYLVRRLLESGANSSFVNQLQDKEIDVATLVADPIGALEARVQNNNAPLSTIVRPRDLFLPERAGSQGMALENDVVRDELLADMQAVVADDFEIGPVISGEVFSDGDEGKIALCLHDRQLSLGRVTQARDEDLERALASAKGAAHDWATTPVETRAACLELTADLIERDKALLMTVLAHEAGKTLGAAQDEIREAIDFLRYYAAQARRLFSGPTALISPTGETNFLKFCGRGPFACISPWNFPVAIFTGQVAAALASGNPVLAKPAEQTPCSAFFITRLFHEAGVPVDALNLLIGDGRLGQRLVSDPRVSGVAFTGSHDTAWTIQKALSERRGAMIPFLAETGGLNAMIADSSALTEQVVGDVVRSAFDSAGQRCSAARVLFVQKEIADRTLAMVRGAVETLSVGTPTDYATDIGPVISGAVQDMLEGYKLKMRASGVEIVDLELAPDCRNGNFVSPAVYEVSSLDDVDGEVFGPILHVIRYDSGALDTVIDALNATGYGLTLGLHSRVNSVAAFVEKHARVGNLYINRDQIGARVGSQPFGGEGLSGTGPKAGGPNYLMRFVTERVRTENTTAKGGNLDLANQPMGSDDHA